MNHSDSPTGHSGRIAGPITSSRDRPYVEDRVGFVRLSAALVGLALLLSLILPRISRGGTALAAFTPPEARAKEIIQRAISAHGGKQAWLRKKDAAYSTTWTHYRGGQAKVTSRYVVKFPIAPGQVPTVVEGDENGKPVVMGVSGSRSWFHVGDERYEDLDSLKANRAFVRRAYGLLALPFRLDNPAYLVSYDGEEVRAGALVDRVRVQGALEAPALYLFDRDSGRLAGMGSSVAEPPTSTVSDFHDFDFVDGILIPHKQVFDRVDAATGGRSRALTVSVDVVRFDNGFSPETFEPPLPR